jgi:uncharacterized protein (TIGR02594 family)
MAQSFIFGGNTPDTYESLQAKRRTAERLSLGALRAPQNVGEGLSALGQAIAYRRLSNQANMGEKAGQDAYAGKKTSVFQTLFGGGQNGAAEAPLSYPGAATQSATIPPVDTPFHGQNGELNYPGSASAGRGADSGIYGTYGKDDRLKLPKSDPLSIAAQNIGLNERDQHAAVQDYLKTGGVNLDPATTAWCAAFVNATLAKSGQQGTGSNMARSFLDWGQGVDQPQPGDIGVLPRGDANGPYGHVGFVKGLNPDGTVALLAGNQGDAVSVQNYPADQFLGFRRGGPQGNPGDNIAAITDLMNDPYAPEGDKMVLAQLLQQQFQAMQPQAPKEPIEVGGVLLDPNTYQPIYDSRTSKALEPQTRIVTGQEAAALGLDPAKSYNVAQGPNGIEAKAIGDGGVNITLPGGEPSDGKLRGKLMEKEGEAWAGYLDAGAVSSGTVQDMQLLDEIATMAPQGPIGGRIAGMFPGINSAADAFTSVVKRVAPTLRAPSSGSTSDIEYDGMVKSLPQLASMPEANAAISGMMKAKAQVNIDRAAVVSAYQNGEKTAAQARDELAAINKRSIMTPELKKILSGLAPGAPSSEAENGGYTIEEVQ